MQKLLRTTPVLALLSLLAACTAPVYDDQADKLLTQLQTDVDTELTTLMTLDDEIQDLAKATDPASAASLAKFRTAAAWEANMAAYDKIKVDSLLLASRLQGGDNWGTRPALNSLNDLQENLVGEQNSMRSLHKADGTLSAEVLRQINANIQAQLNTLVALEAQIRSGQASSGGSASPTAASAHPGS